MLKVCVTDQGRSLTIPQCWMTQLHDSSTSGKMPLIEDGRGVHLIDQCMDDICYFVNNGSNILIMTKFYNTA